MYFYKLKGKQILDLRGNLILSHNDNLVKGRIKSAAPASVRNPRYIVDITRMSTTHKIRASLSALRFIWGASQELDADNEGL